MTLLPRARGRKREKKEKSSRESVLSVCSSCLTSLQRRVGDLFSLYLVKKPTFGGSEESDGVGETGEETSPYN